MEQQIVPHTLSSLSIIVPNAIKWVYREICCDIYSQSLASVWWNEQSSVKQNEYCNDDHHVMSSF